MELNSHINDLLNKLSPAHKIVLNDDEMYLVKLHRNKHFSEWLTYKGAMPIIKPYHITGKTYDKEYTEYHPYDRTGSPAEPLFITLGIVKNTNVKSIEIACCDLEIDKFGKKVLPDIEHDSGIIFNGSFYYLRDHIDHGFYGAVSYDKIYHPIGYLRHSMDRKGISVSAAGTVHDKSDVAPLSVPYEEFGQPVITLDLVKDMMGVILFRNDKTVNFMKLLDYIASESADSTAFNRDQIIMGNLLVHDGEIVMDEHKMAIAVLLKNDLSIPQFTVGKLCYPDGKIFTGLEIYSLVIGQPVHFFSEGHPIIETRFAREFIDLPFCINFLAKSFPDGFPGMVPPGYPNHASDANPRTCAFIDEHNNFFVMHVEGRHYQCGGIGVDLFDLAKMCKAMGAIYAINLDGGGSSKLLWKEQGNQIDSVGLDDYQISNAVLIKPSRP